MSTTTCNELVEVLNNSTHAIDYLNKKCVLFTSQSIFWQSLPVITITSSCRLACFCGDVHANSVVTDNDVSEKYITGGEGVGGHITKHVVSKMLTIQILLNLKIGR